MYVTCTRTDSTRVFRLMYIGQHIYSICYDRFDISMNGKLRLKIYLNSSNAIELLSFIKFPKLYSAGCFFLQRKCRIKCNCGKTPKFDGEITTKRKITLMFMYERVRGIVDRKWIKIANYVKQLEKRKLESKRRKREFHRHFSFCMYGNGWRYPSEEMSYARLVLLVYTKWILS